MIQQTSGGVIVYTGSKKDLHFLLLKYGAGHWDFPKGKLEKDETKQEAALRELEEETGLVVHLDKGFEASLDYYFKDKSKQLIHKVVYFFTGRTETKEIRLSFEHLDYRWMPYKEAYEQLTFKNAKEVLAEAHQFLTSNHS